MENSKNGFYDIVRLCKGGLTLDIPTFDSSLNNKIVDIPWNIEKVRVPRAYALGIFVDSNLEKMYKDGYFTVEPNADFEKEVADLFAPVEDKVNVIDDKTIISYLTKGNRMAVKEMLKDDVNRSKLIVTARENIGIISTSMVKFLEETLNIELMVEDDTADKQ